MATVFQSDVVRYLCCCGSLRRISDVYFCRHCLRLRCPFCVSHEVDSHYCGTCSENMPSAEAKQKKNKCNTCFDCPCCKQTLSVRAASTVVPPDDDPAKVPKKSFYFACGNCRWNSKEVKFENSSTASGPWPEVEAPNARYVQGITEFFRTLACREKCAKDRKYVHKSKFLAAGRHGLAHLLPKRFPMTAPEDLNKPVPLPDSVATTIGVEEAESLDAVLELMDADQATSLCERFFSVERQLLNEKELVPLHKQLLVKRSLRCRVCERNIHKPEYSPVSIKFKIQSNSFYHVPQVRLMAPVQIKLTPGRQTKILIRLSNPIQFPTSVKFLPYVPHKDINIAKDSSQAEAMSNREPNLENCDRTPSESSTDPSPPVSSQILKELHVLPVRVENLKVNCRLKNVDDMIVLPPKDETSEFDDFAETPKYDDDAKFVVWRKANKAAVLVEVKMDDDASISDLPILGFTMEYDYVNTIQALDNRNAQGPQKVRLQASVLVALSDEM